MTIAFTIAFIMCVTGWVLLWIVDRQVNKEQEGEGSVDFKNDHRL